MRRAASLRADMLSGTWVGRTLFAALAITLVLSGLPGCSLPIPGPTPTSPTLASELVFYDWEGDMPQPVLDAFSREYGVKVTYLVYESQEEAIQNMRAGQRYDVVVMDSRFIPSLVHENLLATINYRNVPNFKNIAANYRDLAYDPGNQHSVPYNWGTDGLVVRSDLIEGPVTSWADLWDPRYAGRVAIWVGMPREVMGLTLKSLGYSVNSEVPAELEAALARLLELKPNLRYVEDYDLANSASAMTSGQIVLSMGDAMDALAAREKNPAITYVLPKEGALLWSDTFVTPANSPNQTTAEVFLNFLLRPEIGAQITNESHYATPNEAAYPFTDPQILNDPVIFPPRAQLKNAEIILPYSPEGQKLFDQIWERFIAAAPQEGK